MLSKGDWCSNKGANQAKVVSALSEATWILMKMKLDDQTHLLDKTLKLWMYVIKLVE